MRRFVKVRGPVFLTGRSRGTKYNEAFFGRSCYYMTANILWDRAMRYSKEHKLETHARIVKKASVRLREKGAHGIGVADLMKDAGLTHGGFYAHFDSREALVIEAFAYAMDRGTERWRKLAEQTPADQRFATIVDFYLTPLHRDDPGHGCAIPTLGAEIARESPKTRKAFAAKIEQMIDMLAEQIPDVPRKAARKQAMASIATMMGTLVMARVAGNGELSDELLGAGREAVLERATAMKRPAPRPKKTSAKAAASTRS
jgi:TetR/AcrR family transcriptional regulator, transcriptional repressor for nem operon